MAKSFCVYIYIQGDDDDQIDFDYIDNRYDDHEELLLDLQSILDVSEKTNSWALIGELLIKPSRILYISACPHYE